MIIDFHTHALTPAIKKYRSRYLERDTAFKAIYAREKDAIVTADDLINAMDDSGVAFSVIVNYSWTTLELCRETNDGILEAVSRYPKRLAGFCAVNSLTGDAALKEIERCAAAGAKGVGELRPDTFRIDYNQKDAIKSFADLARRYKLIVMTHASEPVGHDYPGKGQATPDMLYPFISRLTGIPVVCAHWGGGLPFYDLMPEVREALEDVYYDTAASPYLYRPEIYDTVAGLAGADRILFGSDYPVISQKRIISEIRESQLPEANKEEIFNGNARRLLGI